MLVFKPGRRAPNPNRRKHYLARYLDLAKLPAIPEEFDFSAAARPCLEQVLCNDKLGCCTASGVLHVLGLFLAVAGHPTTWPDWVVHRFYSLTTGWNGSPETDNGGDEVTVLNYWRDHGIDGKGSHKILGHLSVDATNPAEVRAAAYLFLNLYFGVSLPDAWIKNMPQGDGFVWDVAGPANENNGHCFVSPGGVTKDGVIIDSWGLRGLITWRAMAAYAVPSNGGELHTVLSLESVSAATKKAPNGFDGAQLEADFGLLGGALKAA